MTYAMEPIGIVRSPISDRVDDVWGDIESVVELDTARFTADALVGLEAFSHCEIVFVLDRIAPDAIAYGRRHPRNQTRWPSVGIFAQRGARRPNRIGVTTCPIISVEGTRLTVGRLDALDGTPVLDIKPCMREFGPDTPVRQPEWATEVMERYYA
jgi:tRNA-Thr(GGU) m(6)t(6)A37 methyltransferase TsaA